MPIDTHTSPEDQALARLREEFPSHRIWRSVHADGRLDGWVASLHDPAAGVEPFVIRASAGELRAALVAERQRAKERTVRRGRERAITDQPAPRETRATPESS